MPIVKWDPFKDLLSIQERMNRLFEAALTHSDVADIEDVSGWSPLADVYETETGITISAELPGIGEKDIDLSISGNVLTLRGERKMEKEMGQETFHSIERTYGPFSRNFSLPQEIDCDKVNASFSNGVLSIFIPKKKDEERKKIKVKVN